MSTWLQERKVSVGERQIHPNPFGKCSEPVEKSLCLTDVLGMDIVERSPTERLLASHLGFTLGTKCTHRIIEVVGRLLCNRSQY